MRGTEDTLELVSWIGRIIILDCSDYKSIYSAKTDAGYKSSIWFVDQQ